MHRKLAKSAHRSFRQRLAFTFYFDKTPPAVASPKQLSSKSHATLKQPAAHTINLITQANHSA
ncbi:hypothetical protein LBMAG48_14740 [Phycisphaerae bacterium]|nr:hypothetical protein LBMAG48_14740 [Phycisphaerae bacterium]